MPAKAFDPQSSQKEETAKPEERAANEDRKDEDTLVKEAIDRATAKCDDQEPLMTQLCRFGAEVDKAKKAAKAKRSEDSDVQNKAKKTREGQTRDPRGLHEVLVQEGIEPHPGPVRGISKQCGCWRACRALTGIVCVSAMLDKAIADNRVGADEENSMGFAAAGPTWDDSASTNIIGSIRRCRNRRSKE